MIPSSSSDVSAFLSIKLVLSVMCRLGSGSFSSSEALQTNIRLKMLRYNDWTENE